MMGQMDIRRLFFRTSESATYTKLLLTIGNLNHGGMGLKYTLGQGEGSMCHISKKKMEGGN
jgi:hypothetical protein